MSLAKAVKTGPAATKAKVGHLDAQIATAEARAQVATEKAKRAKLRAKGNGPLAKLAGLRADALEGAVASHRKRAAALKVAKAKVAEREARRAVKEAKPGRTVASTKLSGLTTTAKPGRASGQPRKADRMASDARRAEKLARREIANGKTLVGIREPQPKGTPVMSPVSGEAVNVEQTDALLAQLRTQVTEIRSSFENAAGSLASAGLDKLAGALSSADDALSSVDTNITGAEQALAPHRDIADLAASAGEMAKDSSFYGA